MSRRRAKHTTDTQARADLLAVLSFTARYSRLVGRLHPPPSKAGGGYLLGPESPFSERYKRLLWRIDTKLK